MKIKRRQVAEALAEFLGTFFLISIILMAGIFGRGLEGFMIGFGLSALILAFSGYSLTHFNPVVTLGSLFSSVISNRKDVAKLFLRHLAYMILQLGGTFLATVVVGWIAMQLKEVGGEVQLTTSFLPEFQNLAFFAEAFFTFVFVMVVLFTTSNPRVKPFAGIAIGITLFVLTSYAVNVSGASFHPFRSLVPALYADEAARGQLWLYILAPMLGASIAGLLHAVFSLLNTDGDLTLFPRGNNVSVKKEIKDVKKQGKKKK